MKLQGFEPWHAWCIRDLKSRSLDQLGHSSIVVCFKTFSLFIKIQCDLGDDLQLTSLSRGALCGKVL